MGGSTESLDLSRMTNVQGREKLFTTTAVLKENSPEFWSEECLRTKWRRCLTPGGNIYLVKSPIQETSCKSCKQ
jgi:hypothetical protein